MRQRESSEFPPNDSSSEFIDRENTMLAHTPTTTFTPASAQDHDLGGYSASAVQTQACIPPSVPDLGFQGKSYDDILSDISPFVLKEENLTFAGDEVALKELIQEVGRKVNSNAILDFADKLVQHNFRKEAFFFYSVAVEVCMTRCARLASMGELFGDDQWPLHDAYLQIGKLLKLGKLELNISNRCEIADSILSYVVEKFHCEEAKAYL
jgi:hypothetical protein